MTTPTTTPPSNPSPVLQAIQSHADSLLLIQQMLKLHLGDQEYNALVAKAYETLRQSSQQVDPEKLKQDVSNAVLESLKETVQTSVSGLAARVRESEQGAHERIDGLSQQVSGALESMQQQQAALMDSMNRLVEQQQAAQKPASAPNTTTKPKK